MHSYERDYEKSGSLVYSCHGRGLREVNPATGAPDVKIRHIPENQICEITLLIKFRLERIFLFSDTIP